MSLCATISSEGPLESPVEVILSSNNAGLYSWSCKEGEWVVITVYPRLSEPRLSEPSIIRIQKQMKLLVQSSRNYYYIIINNHKRTRGVHVH